MVLDHAADGLVHIWWDKEMTSDELAVLKDKSFFVIPTTLTTLRALKTMGDEAWQYLSKEGLFEQIRQLHEAGIPILAGTDPPNLEINYGTDLYKELELLSEAGLSNLEVLKAATSNIALSFGLEDKGFVKPGYLADLLLLEKNPIEDINHISSIVQIWKEGKPLKDASNHH
jgi:imidazolonepropionase-like amidohydrolase